MSVENGSAAEKPKCSRCENAGVVSYHSDKGVERFCRDCDPDPAIDDSDECCHCGAPSFRREYIGSGIYLGVCGECDDGEPLGYGCLSRLHGDAKAAMVQDANGRLMAAAPEMLEALRSCRMHIETLERIHDHELPEGEMLRAAIAKATGEVV